MPCESGFLGKNAGSDERHSKSGDGEKIKSPTFFSGR